MREMTPDECKAYLESAPTRPLLLDVREPWEYNIVHLEDSVLMPMRQVPVEADSLDAEREIIVICHHGIRSRQVALFLKARGFSNVINLSGGMDAWARHTDTSLPTY
ncbi:MAG TPA: rhodanese-like domain-containing protein [Gammaproteobacteria bacterium]|nr:rhodanese-like domain-containing protein [Gammaproteobacteria bacterium]